MEALRRTFRPEFLNRIDEIVTFQRLGPEEIEQIVDIQLRDLQKRLAERKITLELTDGGAQDAGRARLRPGLRRAAAEARHPAHDREPAGGGGPGRAASARATTSSSTPRTARRFMFRKEAASPSPRNRRIGGRSPSNPSISVNPFPRALASVIDGLALRPRPIRRFPLVRFPGACVPHRRIGSRPRPIRRFPLVRFPGACVSVRSDLLLPRPASGPPAGCSGRSVD